jgi:CRP/FNR family nitrogen fixation transcriptional regulator
MHAALAVSPALRPFPAVPVALEMLAVGTTRALSKDQGLFCEGDRATHFYRVVKGTIRSFKVLSDGRRQIDAFYMPGDIFGVEASDEHRFSAEAASDAAVVAYRRRSLQSLAEADGKFAQEVLSSMMLALARAQDHMLLLGRKSALEKVAAFLLGMAERIGDAAVELPMTRMDIADHLGLTIETVSRSLTQLERKGMIEIPANRRSVALCNFSALRRLDA